MKTRQKLAALALLLACGSCAVHEDTQGSSKTRQYCVDIERGLLRLYEHQNIERWLNSAYPQYRWYIVFPDTHVEDKPDVTIRLDELDGPDRHVVVCTRPREVVVDEADYYPNEGVITPVGLALAVGAALNLPSAIVEKATLYEYE